MYSKGTLKRLGAGLVEKAIVSCLILTMVRRYCAADSLRGLILMVLSVLPWAQQLPASRLTQLPKEARSVWQSNGAERSKVSSIYAERENR